MKILTNVKNKYEYVCTFRQWGMNCIQKDLEGNASCRKAQHCLKSNYFTFGSMQHCITPTRIKRLFKTKTKMLNPIACSRSLQLDQHMLLVSLMEKELEFLTFHDLLLFDILKLYVYYVRNPSVSVSLVPISK